MSGHTPGPWRVTLTDYLFSGRALHGEKTWEISADGDIGNWVAHCLTEADARLIAAAPGLLIVAKMAAQVAAMELREGSAPDFSPRELLDAARKAIAQAENL